MLCPKCKKEMIVVERNQVELDWCMDCGGFWFDHGEWNILCKKLISEDMLGDNDDIYELPVALSKEKPRKCPVCGAKMEKFMLGETLLDRCPNRHGVWFDKNEFSACVNNLNTKGKQQVEFLGEVFNK